MTLAPFAHMPSHPGHTHFLLTDSTSIHTTRQHLLGRLGGVASSIAIFRDSTLKPSSLLPPERTLAECGVVGGARDCPRQAELYYDYRPAVTDCPLVMADHYYQPIPLTSRS